MNNAKKNHAPLISYLWALHSWEVWCIWKWFKNIFCLFVAQLDAKSRKL